MMLPNCYFSFTGQERRVLQTWWKHNDCKSRSNWWTRMV